MIVLVDPLRPGHEATLSPGRDGNLRMRGCDPCRQDRNCVASSARHRLRDSIQGARRVNPTAQLVIDGASLVSLDDGDPGEMAGNRVLVIEDGPTLTHGEMAYGAGVMAARKFGAGELVDPRPYAVGSIADTFAKYPQTETVLPAMGYGSEQIADLEATIKATPCDLVLIATPIDLRSLVSFDIPAMRVTYELQELGEPTLETPLRAFVEQHT